MTASAPAAPARHARRGPGRPRNEDIDALVLAAVLELIDDKEEVTAARVVGRSGVSRAALYRRWPSLTTLIAAALDVGDVVPDAVEDGEALGAGGEPEVLDGERGGVRHQPRLPGRSCGAPAAPGLVGGDHDVDGGVEDGLCGELGELPGTCPGEGGRVRLALPDGEGASVGDAASDGVASGVATSLGATTPSPGSASVGTCGVAVVPQGVAPSSMQATNRNRS